MGAHSVIRTYLLVLLIGIAPIAAVHASEEFNANEDGIVIEGYDPVAYFLDRKAIKGKSSISATFEGGTYLFANNQNRQTFLASPSAYVPAYGGWCSYGVRVGKKFKIDPNAWKIVGNRLFLQLDQGTQKVWLKDQTKNIEIADRLWPNLKSMPADALGN